MVNLTGVIVYNSGLVGTSQNIELARPCSIMGCLEQNRCPWFENLMGRAGRMIAQFSVLKWVDGPHLINNLPCDLTSSCCFCYVFEL
jgi:hypothetical protein